MRRLFLLLFSLLCVSSVLAAPSRVDIRSGKGRYHKFVDPSSVPGLKQWYDAADTSTIIGSPVSQWSDKSGNGFHLIQPTSSQRPTTGTIVHGNNTISFAGDNGASSQWMYVNGVSNSPNTVFVVFKGGLASWADWSGLIVWRSALSTKVSDSTYGGGIQGKTGTANVITDGTSISVRTDGVGGALASDFNNFNNGVSFLTAITNTHLIVYTDDLPSPGTINYVVGSDTYGAVGTRHMTGNLCEIIIYDRALPLADIILIESYLILKWIFVSGGGGD